MHPAGIVSMGCYKQSYVSWCLLSVVKLQQFIPDKHSGPCKCVSHVLRLSCSAGSGTAKRETRGQEITVFTFKIVQNRPGGNQQRFHQHLTFCLHANPVSELGVPE